MKTPLLIIVILLGIILFSCEKKEAETLKYFDDSLNVGLYALLFAEGSQWVYQDTVLKTTDTVKFLDVEKDTLVYASTGVQYSSIYYSADASSSLNGAFKWFYIGYVISMNDQNNDYIYLAGKKKNDSLLNVVVEKVIDTLKAGNIKYLKVIKVRVKTDELIRKPMNLYFADSIGIVRKEIINEDNAVEVWDLISKTVTLHKDN